MALAIEGEHDVASILDTSWNHRQCLGPTICNPTCCTCCSGDRLGFGRNLRDATDTHDRSLRPGKRLGGFAWYLHQLSATVYRLEMVCVEAVEK